MMTWQEALQHLRAAQASVVPPGGFDAWLHVLAAPVRGSPPEQGAFPVAAGPTAPAKAQEQGAGTPSGDGGTASSGGGPGVLPGRVRVETSSLTAPNDPQEPLALFFISPAHAGRVLGQHLDRLAAQCRRGDADGFLVHVGLSGMAYRSLADPPPGFVPRYRLPRRTREEPVWAAEPVWCSCAQLAQASGQLAQRLIAQLASRLADGA